MTTHVLVPRRSARLARPLGAGLFGDFDRLFDEFWGSPGSAVSRAATPAALAPRMDYSETDDAIRLRAEMPGLDEKDIDVSLEEGVLTIKGDEDAVEAAYKNGILTVTLPKRPEAKPEVRSIPVSTS
jgi:HSP20 family protein